MRILIPILALILGIAVVLGTFKNAGENVSEDRDQNAAQIDTPADQPGATSSDDATQTPDAPPQDSSPQTPPTEPSQETAVADSDQPSQQANPDGQTDNAIKGLQAVNVPDSRDVTIGNDDTASPYKMRVELSRYGASVKRITLTDYLVKPDEPDHYVVQDKLTAPNAKAPDDRSQDWTRWYAYAANSVVVNGTRIALDDLAPGTTSWSVGEVINSDTLASVTYTATIVDADNNPVLKIVRRYELPPDSYDLSLHQKLINVSDKPLTVRWDQNLQGDLFNDSGYLRERRQFIAGYFAPWWDTQRVGIYTKDAELLRSKAVDGKNRVLWRPQSLNPQAELTWLAATNRYFAIVTHPLLDDSVKKTADVPVFGETFPRIDYSVYHDPGFIDPSSDQKVAVLTAGTNDLTIEPGTQQDLSMSIFAGPRKPELFATPPYSIMHLDQTIVYSLGGPCAFCTFQWLAHGLLWLLKLFEGQILTIGGVGIGVHDWGVAIIILVLLVRLLLHPITKRAQINMMKMGKQMQTIQPEVEKLKKKYKDDQQRINTEMMKLYREKGINPANALGCLPMFLQTPIWIALYAMLYYAIELRHEPAFWGFFQKISGGSWQFLADLSQSDNFIQVFEDPIKLNLFFIHPNFQSINILPLLMAIVFFFQQKLTTPPPANEQAAQQQKIMRVMILLFPVFLYSAPAGLTLYILASTAAGVVDSTIVRRHIKEQEESGELFTPKKPPKPGSLRDRLGKALEAKQRELAEKQAKAGKGNPPRNKPRKKR